MEARSEQERYESGALSRELAETPEQHALRELIDRMGQIALTDGA